jgi:hypothetical protein
MVGISNLVFFGWFGWSTEVGKSKNTADDEQSKNKMANQKLGKMLTIEEGPWK